MYGGEKMSDWNCTRGFKCTTLAVLVSIVLGFVAAILRFTAVITVTPAFLWVTFGFGVVYLALALLGAVFRGADCRTCFEQTLNALLLGALGTILFSVVLLAVTFVATSVWGAVLTGVLIAFFSLLLTMTACLVKCVADNN